MKEILDGNMERIEEPRVDSKPIDEITRGYQLAQVLFTAMNYDLFTHLKEGKTAEELAQELKTDFSITRKFMNALVSLRLISKKAEKYVNSELARSYLVKGSPFYQRNLINLIAQGSNVWSNLGEALRGEPIPKKTNEKRKEVFDRSFILAMAEAAMRGPLQRTIKAVSRLDEFKKARRLLDLGGGHGLYAIGFAQENPSLKTFIFDLPPVTEVAKDFIKQYGMQYRVDVLAGDYIKDNLGGKYDVIFVSDTFYQKRESLQIPLKKVYSSLNNGGLIILKHWVMNEDGTGKPTVVFWDLWLSLLGYPHYVYTLNEYVEVLKQMNFSSIQTIDISTSPDPSAIIIGKKEAR